MHAGRLGAVAVAGAAVLALGLLAVAVTMPPLPAGLLALATAWVLAWRSGVAWREWLALLAVPAGFIATGAAALSLTVGESGIGLAADGGRQGLAVAVRALASVSALLLLAVTTPTPALLDGLRRPGLPRARVFLGNGGSALLGLVIAWASLRLTQNPEHPVTAILLPWLLVPPVVDAVALVLRRAAQGRSPFAADRNHMHHFMLDAGFSPSQIALALGGMSLGLGGLAALALRNDWLEHTVLVLVYVAMTIAWFLLTWRRERAVAFFATIHQRRRVSVAAGKLAQGEPDGVKSMEPDRGHG